MKNVGKHTYRLIEVSVFVMGCGCHCIKCGSTSLESKKTGKIEKDGYFDMHHTCKKCNTHFDHLEGDVFDSCRICNYSSS